MKSRITLFLLAVSLGAAKGDTVYRYNTYYELPKRPCPVELLLDVVEVKNVKPPKPLIKSPSIMENNYTKEVVCTDSQKSEKVTIRMTEPDFAAAGPIAKGDTLAAFGLEKGRGVIVKLVKYDKASAKSDVKKWFEGL